ncbi:MAG: hypothetical protein GX640_13905, partial [Fibrobacter sp.]|nr:hypothetical protein [Fibrobacter sp.]
MIVLTVFFLGFALLLLYVYSPFKRPFLTESDWATHKAPFWQLYYSSKFLCQVRRPRRNSGLEELFSADMSPDPSREPLKDQKTIKVTSVGDLMCRRDLLGVGGEGLYEHVG